MNNKDLREPLHIIIDGIGGLHCDNNEKILKERVEYLENVIKRTLDSLKGLKKELENPTSEIPFDLKFNTVLDIIEYDCKSVFIDPREYYPNIYKEDKDKKGE